MKDHFIVTTKTKTKKKDILEWKLTKGKRIIRPTNLGESDSDTSWRRQFLFIKSIKW